MTRKFQTPKLFLILTMLLIPGLAKADYVIGIDDVLQVTFWQAPNLDQSVVVNADGKVTLSVIGEITAAGLTTSQLSRKIVEQVSRFNRDISQATVVVTAFNSQTVFVEGQVISPGRYAREVIPDLWTIIKEMGGPTPTGDLTNVRVIRGGAVDPGSVLTVDVLSAISTRDFSKLPEIHAKDIIRIPPTLGGVTTSMPSAEGVAARNVFYIVGAVARPNAYTMDSKIDLLEAIALAGGSSPDADLKKVRISSKSGEYANVYEVNLDKQLKTGSPKRYILGPEDAIYIPSRGTGATGGFNLIRDIITLGTTVTSTVLLIDRLGQ